MKTMFDVYFILIFLTLIKIGNCDFVKCIADCVELKDCYEAKMYLKENGTNPDVCGFNGTEPLVCCAAENEKTLFDIHYAGLRKADKKCKELDPTFTPGLLDYTYNYHEYHVKTSDEHAVYGGWAVTDYEFTFMTALGYGDPKNPLYRCGGVLVHSNVVITAAHCVDISGEPPSVARIGSTALLSNDSKPIKIVKVIPHPNYNQQTDQNDIAIIILAENSKATPACLFSQRVNLRHDSRSIALGFGTTTFGGRFSDDLMKTYYNIIRKDFCEKEYQGQTLLNSQLCVLGERRYFENGTSLVQDTCQGDSGGPLVIGRNHNYVVGVVSYGRGCGSETPGIYTHIASYTNWINSMIFQEGNISSLRVCSVLEPPYITASICSGGGKNGKSCSGIAYVGDRFFSFSSHAVQLGYGDINNPIYECDGVLIEKNVVITAAQCAQVDGKKPLVVQIYNNVTRVVKVISHPNYEYKSYINDIAILFLAENSRGSPACLASSSIDWKFDLEWDYGYAAVFGTSSFDGPLVTELLQINVNITDKSICDKELDNKPLPDSLVCVLEETDYLGEDTYQVNSGGTLYINRFPKQYVVGIVSYVNGHVIYTNITSHLDWIESVVWPEDTQAERFYIT